jgi:hypothetical protein
MSYCGILGVFGIFQSELAFLESDRMYGRSIWVEHFVIFPMLVYQIWNFCMSLILNHLRTGPELAHHFVGALLPSLALIPTPFLQYYCVGMTGWVARGWI